VAPYGRTIYSLSMVEDGLRASHEDRDRVVDVLRVAAGDGRLSAEELDQRIELALTARTYGELSALVADLPTAQPGVAAAPKPKDVLRIDRFGGNARRDGRWVLPRRIEVRVTGGNVTLDFTEAIITLPSLQISAVVAGGNLIVITKPGVVVDTDEVMVAGGNVKARKQQDAEVPVLLRAEVTGKVIGGNIIVRPPRPPRRTFLQWFRRERGSAAITARLSLYLTFVRDAAKVDGGVAPCQLLIAASRGCPPCVPRCRKLSLQL
jgi:uncharacterized protein DUF1707